MKYTIEEMTNKFHNLPSYWGRHQRQQARIALSNIIKAVKKLDNKVDRFMPTMHCHEEDEIEHLEMLVKAFKRHIEDASEHDLYVIRENLQAAKKP